VHHQKARTEFTEVLNGRVDHLQAILWEWGLRCRVVLSGVPRRCRLQARGTPAAAALLVNCPDGRPSWSASPQNTRHPVARRHRDQHRSYENIMISPLSYDSPTKCQHRRYDSPTIQPYLQAPICSAQTPLLLTQTQPCYGWDKTVSGCKEERTGMRAWQDCMCKQ
jgi:hypothetical protein